MGKKRKAAVKAAKATKAKNVQAADQTPDQAREARRAARDVRRAMADERRAKKMERRRKDRGRGTDADWALPAPAGLIARLEKPKVKSKYHSYFEFAENAEKKKKLEFQVCIGDNLFLTTDFCNRSQISRDHHQASNLLPSVIPHSPMHAKSSLEHAML
jgi:hypothetical protein